MTIIRDEELDLYAGPYGLEHDLPLTFHWRTHSQAIAALDLPPTRSPRREDARNAVLTEAVLADEGNHWVSFSRRKDFYSGRRRYHGNSFTYRYVLGAVADGVGVGFLQEDRALASDRGAFQSRFRATPLLSTRMKNSPLHFEQHEVIWLKRSHRQAGRLRRIRAHPPNARRG